MLQSQLTARCFHFLAHENVELLFGFCSSLLGLFRFGAEKEMLRICSQYHLMGKSGKKRKQSVTIDKSVGQESS